MKKRVLCGLALLTVSACALHAQVKVHEGTLSLPYYQEGPPNPNAPFDQYATNRFNYPYVLRDNLTSHLVERAFRAVYLENEYLKCVILPDVGGHIYTCTDRINNIPMFYENPSIKEAAIGMRGGWAAFGLEFNFPVSHNWMTVSPIDFAYGKEDDGSAFVTVGNIDRMYGMEWSVRVVLHPGSTLLELRVTLNNRSDVRHRFYWWSNGGIQAWDDTRISYPMHYSAAHGFADVDRWPVDSSGTDLSIVGNHTHGPVSRFVHGSREPFMGIWNPHTNAGVAHFAEYSELPAKKIWSWGGDADGLDWRKALSDNNSAYVEVQGGLFRNQETYAFLEPRQTIRFSEYWMPLHELGGLARANLSGAVNLIRTGNTLTASLNVNRKFPGAELRLLDSDHALYTETADLAPEHTWTHQIVIPDRARHYTVEVRDHSGKVLISQTEGNYDWTPDSEIHVGPQKQITFPKPSQRSADDWVQVGQDDELNGRLLVASKEYEEGLKAFPQSQSITIAAGRLYTALLQFDRAIPLLKEAEARDTPNPEIAYYMGLAYDGLDDTAHAQTAYETAARLPQMRAAAALRLGELAARAGDLASANSWLADALHSGPDDLRTAEELAAVLNARGKINEARSLAADWYRRYPTSYFLAEVLSTPQIEHLAAEPERVLNVAAEYMRLGLYEPALAVLSRNYPHVDAGEMEPGAVAPAQNPIVGYYKAFCLQKLGRPYAQEASRASRLPVLYVFPSGAQTAHVLEFTLKNNADDTTAQYLLGMLQFSTGMTESAEAHWTRAHDLHAVLPGLDANRGLARLHIDSDPEGALAAFREGIKNDSSNDAIYLGMDQALSILSHPASEFVAAMDQYPDKPNMRAKLVYELALHQAEAGNYTAAQDLLRNRFFPREEGGTNVREVWIEIDLRRLQSVAKSGQCDQAAAGLENLNQPQPGMVFTQDGLDPFIDTGRSRYEIAMIDRTCKRTAEANEILKKVAANAEGANLVWAEKAARLLPAYDANVWRGRLSAALALFDVDAQTNSYTTFTAGMLQQEAGEGEAARATFRKVFLLPDQTLSYHLTRLAVDESETKPLP
jgi:tetratricopeptide (TPR) repeat protein